MFDIFRNSLDRRSFLKAAALGGAALTATGCHSLTSSSASAHESRPDSGPDKSSANKGSDVWGPIIDARILLEKSDLEGECPLGEPADTILASIPTTKATLLKKEMEKARTKFVFAHGRLLSPPEDPLGIEGSLEVAALVRGVKVVGVADPTRIERGHLMRVERQIEKERDKLVGLLGPVGQIHVAPNDPRFVPYYALAAKYRLPFIVASSDLLTSKASLKFSQPLLVDEVAMAHPSVQFVILHFGVPWHLDAAEVVLKNDNVWTDLSGLFTADEEFDKLLSSGPLPDAVRWCVISEVKNRLTYMDKYDRVLYASDWPFSPMTGYRRFIETIIPKEHHEKVFRTNAEQLFRIS